MAKTDNLTILFVDIVGYTARTSSQSREANDEMLRDFHRVMRPLIAGFGGRYVKSIGDAILATFRSPTDGVRCAMAMHDAISDYNGAREDLDDLEIRVALNGGEVMVEAGDVIGEAVNVASRVEGLTPTGQVYFTDSVYLSMNKAEVPSKLVGEQALKGIPEPVRIYRVPRSHVPRLTTPADTLPGLKNEPPFGGIHHTVRPRRTLDQTRDEIRWWLRPGWPRRLLDGLRHWLNGDSRPDRPRWRQALSRPVTWPVSLFAAVVIVSAVGATQIWLAGRTPASGELRAEQDGAVDPLDVSAAGDDEALIRLLTGHFSYLKGDRDAAVDHYAAALAMRPDLADDADLAANLVACLSWASEKAIPLIQAHPSEAMVEALAKRTGQPGGRGASRAARLLEGFGQARRIDRTPMLIRDYQRQTDCKERLGVLRQIREQGDARAIPAIDESISGVGNWFSNGCLYDEAKATIAILRKRGG